MGAIEFRDATESDVPFLLALRKTTMDTHIRTVGLTPDDESHLQRIYHRFDCAKIIIFQSKSAGLFKAVKECDAWDLVQIQILPEFQGMGVGERIISDLLIEASNKDVLVKLSVFKNNPAQKLYQRLGFEIVEETETAFEMQTSK